MDQYHGYFDYSAIIDRPPLRWPNGAHVAVWIVPNIEHADVRTSDGGFDVRGVSPQEYGNRVGVWRLMELMDRFGVRGTVALHGVVCELFPRVVEEALKRDWELMGHGLFSRQMGSLSEEREREFVFGTRDLIEKASGKPPRGWLGPGLTESPRTTNVLKEAGYDYVCDWVNDDQPYRMRNGIYSIPYSVDLNDRSTMHAKDHTAAQYCQFICDAFDVLYREGAEHGRVMCIALHPYIIGMPSRIGYLEKALEHIRSHEKVWFATGSEIIDAFKQQESKA
jgi:peptidoglycan/xylan/chitin deacetylase (PgdA/CDA1 family)